MPVDAKHTAVVGQHRERAVGAIRVVAAQALRAEVGGAIAASHFEHALPRLDVAEQAQLRRRRRRVRAGERRVNVLLHQLPAELAGVRRADDAIAIDEHAVRQPEDAVCVRDHQRRIHRDAKRWCVEGIEERGRVAVVLAGVDGDHAQVAGAELRLHRFQVRHLGEATRAPGRPEVNDRRLAAKVAQAHCLAIRRCADEVACGIADVDAALRADGGRRVGKRGTPSRGVGAARDEDVCGGADGDQHRERDERASPVDQARSRRRGRQSIGHLAISARPRTRRPSSSHRAAFACPRRSSCRGRSAAPCRSYR